MRLWGLCMEQCGRTSIHRELGAVVGICCLVATLWFTAHVNDLPVINYTCALCAGEPTVEGCNCPTTEDICVWGVMQKMRWERVYAFLILCLMVSYSLALIVERWLKYSLASKQSRDFLSGVTAALQTNRAEDAIRVASLYPESPVATVVNASFQHRRTECEEGGFDLRAATHARQRAVVFVGDDLRRGLWTLAALGWAVPLVSAFLSVSGVILAFKGMIAAEGTGVSAIAGGLADSLWPTAFSMLATIPIVWSHKYFAAKAGSLQLEMDGMSAAIIGEIEDLSRSNQLQAPSSRRYVTRELDALPTFKLAD